ncbi:MAG: diacylglycerol kinase [Usitatibacter sp.]
MLEPRNIPLVEEESPFKGKTGIVRVRNAFFNSIVGLSDAWRHESAFRQEVLLAAVMIPAAFFLTSAAMERAMLVAVVLLVLIVELLNSSVEAAIDRISFDHHSLSKRAKDIGSAAVFVSLVLCVSVWALVLLGR